MPTPASLSSPTMRRAAGHALGGLATGVRLGDVWVDWDGRGMCHYHGQSTATCALAGPAAEWHDAHPDTRPAASTLARYLATGHRDICDAAQLLEGRFNGDALVAAWMRARAVVVDQWGSVVAVARALQRHWPVDGP